mmetsp:Transcript_85639/g.183550  ORF Transcript_85639/g.183550 Transcript_85639/m.183550 type:complete len:229 (+) Transcript_85639:2536-3222(+)
MIAPEIVHNELIARAPLRQQRSARDLLTVVVNKAPISRVFLMHIRFPSENEQHLSAQGNLVSHHVVYAQTEPTVLATQARAILVGETDERHDTAIIEPELAGAEVEVSLIEISSAQACKIGEAVHTALGMIIAQGSLDVLSAPSLVEHRGVHVPGHRRERLLVARLSILALLLEHRLLLGEGQLAPRPNCFLWWHQPLELRPRALRDIELSQRIRLGADGLCPIPLLP